MENIPKNTKSSFLSVVPQQYLVDVSMANVIKGNSAVLKCNIPSFVADFVTVKSWVTDDGDVYYPSNNYGNFYVVQIGYSFLYL